MQHLYFTNANVIISGWGITETEFSSPELLKTPHFIIDNQSCKKKLDNQTKVFERQLCTINKYNSVCKGDRGGPLQGTAKYFGDDRMVQHGIISYTSVLCDEPSISTRVDYYMDWILDSIVA